MKEEINLNLINKSKAYVGNKKLGMLIYNYGHEDVINKVIELSDESDDKPVNNNGNEPTVIEHIHNIGEYLKDRSEENVRYVQTYIEDWVEFLMQNKF